MAKFDMFKGNFFDGMSAFYKKHYVLSNLLLMAAVAVFLGFFAMFFLDIWTSHGRVTMVPEVRNMPFSEAIATLDHSGLDYEISDSIYDTNVEPGMVKEVWPHPGSMVKPGRVVFLTINSFTPQQKIVNMPLTGVSSRQAITYLESLNIKNIRIVYVPSNFPDLVEGATYKGKPIKPGMKLPVNANVVLEVGTLTRSSSSADFDYDAPADSDAEASTDASAEEEIMEQLSKSVSEHDSQEHKSSEPMPQSNPDIFD